MKSSKSKQSEAKIVRYFSLGLIDLSGAYYDEPTGHLYIISDATNVFLEIDKEGIIIKEYAFPGDNQEGIILDDEGHIYIAQDSGGIIKFKYKRTNI